MNDFLKNAMLNLYFTADALIPGCGGKELFSALADMFAVENAEELYALCASREVCDMDSAKKFCIRSRVNALHFGEPDWLAVPETEDIIAVKGKALISISDLKLALPYAADSEKILGISSAANRGIVPAMTAYGVALYEGLGLEKSREEGLGYLRRAAKWNCVEAAVACLRYDGQNAQSYIDKIYSVLKHTPYLSAAETLAMRFGVQPAEDLTVSLLEKSFERGIASREQYNFKLSRVINCAGLNIADKRKIIFSESKDYLSAVSSLPLNVTPFGVREISVETSFCNRLKEKKDIDVALSNACLASEWFYRPLCISCDENYLLNDYYRAIKNSLKDCNVIKFDVAGGMLDGRSSAFIAALKENKPNAVIFELKGVIGENSLHTVIEFLKGDRRKNYKVDQGVSLDLSGVLPVCIADGRNAAVLGKYCTVVKAAPLSKTEKKTVIVKEADGNGKVFGFDGVSLERSVTEKLAESDIDTAIDALNRTFQTLPRGKVAKVTLERVEKFLNKRAGVHPLGFGGDGNDG